MRDGGGGIEGDWNGNSEGDRERDGNVDGHISDDDGKLGGEAVGV